jgi:hypothetical protein
MAKSSAERSRDYRARQGAVTGRVGRPASEPCGTNAAYVRHRARGEEVCEACRKARSAYVASRRRARRDSPGVSSRSGRPTTAPCGSNAAYARHQRRGEQPCLACLQARAEYVASRRKQQS